MKKIFSLLLFFILLFGIYFKPAKAEEAKISYIHLNEIYYNLNINGKIESNGVTMFKLKERIAYCIEPGVEINQRYYEIFTSWDNINLSNEVKEYIELIGYYGYEYPGHNTEYYYIATQELIWKAIKSDIDVSWSTAKNNSGNIIDVTKEKDEIKNLIAKHKLIPSFANKLIKGQVGTTVTLTDENNVLEDYNIAQSKYHKIIKENNQLIITLNESPYNEEIELTRKYYDSAPLLIYSKGTSQKLAALRVTSDKKATLEIKSEQVPEEIEVPNTGLYDITPLIGTFMLVHGLALYKKN